MSKKKIEETQRVSKLNPLNALLMYETLTRLEWAIKEKEADGHVEFSMEELSGISKLLEQIRNGKELDDIYDGGYLKERNEEDMARKTKEPEQLETIKESTVVDINPKYQVHMGVKTPSTQVQYRMLEANVTVSGNDPDDLMEDATNKLAQAILFLTKSWGELPPDDIRDTLGNIYDEDTLAEIYGETE